MVAFGTDTVAGLNSFSDRQFIAELKAWSR
jgi:hypothetical protein